jgi:hypothetical protein
MVAAAHAGVDRFWLTGARDEGGSGDTLDSEVSPGLCGGCFDVRAGHNLDAAQESNQRPLGSGPGWTLRRLPIAPQTIICCVWM